MAHAEDSGFDLSAEPAPVVSAPVSFDNEVTVGVDAVTQKSAAFGRYNGLNDSGFGTMGSLNLNNRDAWDSGKTDYFHFDAYNVDFGRGTFAPESSANLKVGEQGTWGMNFGYDAMTYTASDHFTTILDSSGRLVPGMVNALTSNGAFINNANLSGNTAANFYSTTGKTNAAFAGPALGSTNEVVDNIGTRRDKGTVGGNYLFRNWLLTSSFSDEHKEGTLEQSMTTAGSNTGFVAFPMPVNYDTENFKAAAAYSTQQLQAKLSYNFSNFIDNNAGGYAFQGWNFAAVSNGLAAPNTRYTSYEMNGIYALPPSNQAHEVTGEVGYNVTPSTRINGTLKYGLQLQNDPFDAATGNAYTLTNATTSRQLASNPGSLNGFVNTIFGNAAVTSTPMDKVNLRASYTADLRDPETKSMGIYGDPTDTTALKYRLAVPEGWTKQGIALEAGYHILPSTRATLGYAFRDDRRSNAITHETQENEGSAKVHTTFTPNLMGSIGYVHNERTASAPDYSLWNVQINSDCGSSVAAGNTLGCQQVPFYEAARTEDAVTTNLMGTIAPDASANLFIKFANDQYHNNNATYNNVVNPSVGINQDYSLQIAPSLNYHLSEDTNVHVFYTFLRDYRTMRALNAGSGVTVPGVGYYSETSTYDIHTAGVGGDWHATDKLKLTADYTVSYGNQAFSQGGSWDTTQASQTFGGDPNLSTNSMDHVVRLNAAYDYTSAAELFVGYEFDSLSMSDWAMTGASVGQVLTGDVPARYNVSTVMAGMKLKF
jgi:MtrB/PioB family decaheme-associated outer membrane protein